MPTVAVDTARLLVTPEEVASGVLSAFDVDVSDTDSEAYAQVALACGAAQERLDGYLNRTLFVHATTEWPTSYTYDRMYGRYRAHLPEWPLVETADVEVSALRLAKGGQQIVRTTLPEAEDFDTPYVAGFRGHQHADLAALPDRGEGEPLEALATLPPLIPDLLHQVLVDLAYLRLDMRASGMLGGKRKTQTTGQITFIAEGYRKDAEMEILVRAHVYRRVTV